MVEIRKTAGELAKKAKSDTTNYNVLELGHAICEDIPKQIRDSIEIYKNMIDEPEFCVVMQYATDPLFDNALRRKFFCWPYLPKPRPSQSVWLYNKAKDCIVKRLWVLPHAAKMARLSSEFLVPKEYKTMQAWSVAFFSNQFWEYVRYESGIEMPSESEYLAANREKLIQAGCKVPTSKDTEPFDFSKIHIKNVVDTVAPVCA